MFEELFRYNYETNQKLSMRLLQSSSAVSDQSLNWFSHILNAQHIWNSRILHVPIEYVPGTQHKAADFSAIDEANYAASLLILDEFDLDQSVTYTNTEGRAYTNVVRDVLFHIINHSTYHRGQIAWDMRKTGLEPLPSDYIAFKR